MRLLLPGVLLIGRVVHLPAAVIDEIWAVLLVLVRVAPMYLPLVLVLVLDDQLSAATSPRSSIASRKFSLLFRLMTKAGDDPAARTWCKRPVVALTIAAAPRCRRPRGA